MCFSLPIPFPIPIPTIAQIPWLSMIEGPLDAIAHVECRSEGKGDEYPIAVFIGGERFRIVDVIDRAIITSIVAGEAVRQRFWVELEDGRRCELSRIAPDGAWRVKFEG